MNKNEKAAGRAKPDRYCRCQHYRSDHVGADRIIKGKEVFRARACMSCECNKLQLKSGLEPYEAKPPAPEGDRK